MEDKVLKQLAELKNQYQKGHVSVMVGAGFSKNACPEFPSWNELLYDMVDELFQGEIESAFLRYLKLNPSSKMSLDVFKKVEKDRIINRRGALNIVSEYIAQKGFRESIEHYIEERIPYIDEENSEFKFTGKNENKIIKIKPINLSAHIKLVKGQHWVNRYTTNYDRLLEYAANITGKKFTKITKAKKLSVFSDDPTIIKLHGDLQHPKEHRDFRFDGNPHQQYIISAEDYKNYPKEHEAFTQLMRISLLQGVFCLIGFSGDDPNFVNWIEWVRDILEREERTDKKKEKDYKIYLIGLSSKMPKREKALFYENHNIFYVPIIRDDVKQEIGALPNGDIREVFCKFFDYIEKDNYPSSGNEGRRNLEQAEKNEYQLLWNQVYETKIEGEMPHFTEILVIDEEKLKRLRQVKIWNRFVNNTYWQNNYLSHIRSKKKLTISEAQLSILALNDTGIPIDNHLIKIILESCIGKDDLKELHKLMDRAKSLGADWTDDEKPLDNTYELIICYLFDMDFTSARAILNNWAPVGNDVLKKAMLLYFFMEDGAKELLSEYLKQEGNAKERFYATRLLNLVEGIFPQKHSLARFENANIQDYAKVLSNYIRRVKDNKENIVRYGDGKNEKIIYLDGNKPNKLAESMAVLNFMIEAPSLPSYRNFFTNVSAENWYLVHKNLFERFPFAILFYDISCQDKKVRARIGQDYSYSDHLKETCLDKLLVNMLTAFLSEDTPAYLKESMLAISKELFVSVPSVKWEKLFMKIWDKEIVGRRFDDKENRLNDVLDAFINKGLNSLKNVAVRQRVIVDVLKNSKKDTGFAINCLYYLHVVKSDGANNEELIRTVIEFCANINKSEEITIAGNIHRLLDNEQKELVSQKCVMLLSHSTGNSIERVVYQSAQFFIKDDPEKRRVFVMSVCNSPLLWKSGITPEGYNTSSTFLKLTSFIHRIYIDKESLFIIYDRMKGSLDEIARFGEKHKTFPLLGDIDGLLSEMLSFMNYFKDRLAIDFDYNKVYTTAQRIMRDISGVNNTEDGLLSQYEEELRNALSFIYVNRDSLTHKEILRYANIVIYRAMMQNSDGLDTCIGYLRLYLEEGLIGKDDEALMEELVTILNRYNKDIAQECNMNLVMTTRDMSKIGKTLKKYGYSSEGIDYWIKLQASGRFVTNF